MRIIDLSEKRKYQLRSQKYYQKYKDLLAEIKKANCKAEILLAIHGFLDANMMYHYGSHAASAEEAISVVIEDELPEEYLLLRL